MYAPMPMYVQLRWMLNQTHLQNSFKRIVYLVWNFSNEIGKLFSWIGSKTKSSIATHSIIKTPDPFLVVVTPSQNSLCWVGYWKDIKRSVIDIHCTANHLGFDFRGVFPHKEITIIFERATIFLKPSKKFPSECENIVLFAIKQYPIGSIIPQQNFTGKPFLFNACFNWSDCFSQEVLFNWNSHFSKCP